MRKVETRRQLLGAIDSNVSVEFIPPDMEEGYERVGFYGQGTRYAIYDDEAPDTNQPYFKDEEPGMVAFLDFFVVLAPDKMSIAEISIGFMATRQEYRNQGLANLLVQHLYDEYPGVEVRWGKLMHDATEHMYRKRQQEEREQGTVRTRGGKF